MKKIVNGVEVDLSPEEEQEVLLQQQLDLAASQAYEDSYGYIQKRVLAYGPVCEQLDMLYRDIKNGTLDQFGELFTHIDTVKTDIPKPV